MAPTPGHGVNKLSWLSMRSFSQAQQSLDLIQGELSKVTDNAGDLIENSSLSSQRVRAAGSVGVVTVGGVRLCMYGSKVVTLSPKPAGVSLTGRD